MSSADPHDPTQHRQAPLAEKASLDQKLANLDAFLFSSRSEHLSEDERGVLLRQRSAMQDYSAALGERIVFFKGQR